MLAVQVLGTVVVGDEVRVGRDAEGIGLLLVPGAGRRGAIHKVATGGEVKLAVHIKGLQLGNATGAWAGGRGAVAGGRGVGGVCAGRVVLAQSIEEIPA